MAKSRTAESLAAQYEDTSWLANGRYIFFSSLLEEENSQLQRLGTWA